MIKVAIASDHAGYAFKESLKEALSSHYEWLDLGTHTTESVDYPDFGQAMGEAITNRDAEKGILICGTGIGISIAANRYAHVRAALCTNDTVPY